MGHTVTTHLKAVSIVRKAPPTSLPAFSTPGFGRAKPTAPAPAPLHAASSNDCIEILSSNDSPPTSPMRNRSVKRTSSDANLPPPISPKRQRTFFVSNKESVFVDQKGKGKERQTTAPTTPSSTLVSQTSACGATEGAMAAVRCNDHSDLQAVSLVSTLRTLIADIA